MTKRREPGGFGHAMTVIAARLGWDACAEIVGKTPRAVRNWSEDDRDALPTLQEAFDLDAAYLAAGAGDPPLLATYARMLDQVAPRPETDHLAEVAAKAAKEVGEFQVAAIRAVSPGACRRAREEAAREGIEAITAIGDFVAHTRTPPQVA